MYSLCSPHVFISHRSQDSAATTEHVRDCLVARLGSRHVCIDRCDGQMAVHWKAEIEQAIIRSSIVLVVIGPNWLAMTDAGGNRCLDNPDDPVNYVIRMAAQHNKKLVPLLVNNATMPVVDDLPPDLRHLAERHGIEIRPGYVRKDIDYLINLTAPYRVFCHLFRLAVLAAVMIVIVAALASQPSRSPAPTPIPIWGTPATTHTAMPVSMPGMHTEAHAR